MNSLTGWVVGGVVLVGVAILIVVLVFFPGHSAPTEVTTEPGVLDLHEMPTKLADLLGSEPTGEGNAGDYYVKALDVYRKDRDTWKALGTKMDRVHSIAVQKDQGDTTPAVVGEVEKDLMKQLADHCRSGAQKASMDYCVEHGQKPSVQLEQSDMLAYQQLADCMNSCLIYQAYVVKDYPAAEQIAKDLIVLGWHIVKERAYPETVMVGYSIQGAACEMLAEIYTKDPKLAPADMIGRLRDYRAQAQIALNDGIRLQAIWNVKPEPGDFFNVIENSKDPAWKVQGLLGLGILKFRCEGDRGDRVYIERLMADYAANGTELQKRAVKAAQDFTRDEYRVGQQLVEP